MPSSKFNGLVMKENQHFSPDELITYARHLSSNTGDIRNQLLHWDFGPMMVMKFDPHAQNYLFSKEEVPFHWDGAFYREPAQLLFYCTKTQGQGGETLFLNTELLWDSLSKAEKAECLQITLTYSTEKKAHYGGEIKIPLVQRHPKTGKTILRMAERVETLLNPVRLSISGTPDPIGFYERLIAKFRQPDFMYEHRWKKGDLLICDNFTYLHGRNALRDNRSRSFQRIQIL